MKIIATIVVVIGMVWYSFAKAETISSNPSAFAGSTYRMFIMCKEPSMLSSIMDTIHDQRATEIKWGIVQCHTFTTGSVLLSKYLGYATYDHDNDRVEAWLGVATFRGKSLYGVVMIWPNLHYTMAGLSS